MQTLAAALDKGADLITVDPRFSVAAGKSRYWLPIRPGTDIALLLAWMNVLINEGLYDRDYVEALHPWLRRSCAITSSPSTPSGPTSRLASSRR